jgi:lysophospholipase L1-like esterase
MRVLALGDSYTIGEGVAPESSWPAQLVARLRNDGLAMDQPVIIAQTGWTTTELTAALDQAVLEPPYDLVTLLVGVNDQYRDWSETLYPERYAALLERAVVLAGGEVRRCVAVSIPDWSTTAFAANDARGSKSIAAAIDRYNAMGRQQAEARGVAFVDVTAISRSEAFASALVADGLHPSDTQYRAWVDEAIAPVVRGRLTRR